MHQRIVCPEKSSAYTCQPPGSNLVGTSRFCCPVRFESKQNGFKRNVSMTGATRIRKGAVILAHALAGWAYCGLLIDVSAVPSDA